VIHIFSIGKQQYVTKRGSFARFDVEKIDIDSIAFRDAKLPATSSDDCVSHSFSGEKKPSTIPRLSRIGKRKARSCAEWVASPFARERREVRVDPDVLFEPLTLILSPSPRGEARAQPV
jgi:hypothetical protein